MTRWSSRKLGIAVGLFFLVIVVIFARAGSPTNPMATESGRVQHAFKAISAAVSKSEPLPLPWITPVHAGTVKYSDSSKASLWVPKPSPQGNRSNCFYVDRPSKGGASGFYDSLCKVAKAEVILDRQGRVVIGFQNIMARASFAIISSDGSTVDAPITYGYFMFPSLASEDLKAKFTISFKDPDGATCKVVGLLAPGRSDSLGCVIP